MTQKTHFSLALLAGTALTFPALAQQISAESVLEAYQAQGYDFIEISEGPNQIKVEAVAGTITLETIYDIRTGEILESEQQATSSEYLGRIGFEIDSEDEDFVGDEGSDEDDGEDDDEDDEEDDDEDDEEDDDDEGDDEEDDQDDSDEDDGENDDEEDDDED